MKVLLPLSVSEEGSDKLAVHSLIQRLSGALWQQLGSSTPAGDHGHSIHRIFPWQVIVTEPAVHLPLTAGPAAFTATVKAHGPLSHQVFNCRSYQRLGNGKKSLFNSSLLSLQYFLPHVYIISVVPIVCCFKYRLLLVNNSLWLLFLIIMTTNIISLCKTPFFIIMWFSPYSIILSLISN